MVTERTVEVDLGSRSYAVRIAPGLLAQLGSIAAEATGASRAVMITDSTVGELYGRQAAESLASAGIDLVRLHFAPGERNKTLATYENLMDGLLGLAPPIDRRTLIVALGGGVVGDVAGFVAASALRGLPVLQCPTTLLADVDSSVGGKTGIDHPAGKNLIGAFHQPRAVVIDPDTLRSLPAAELHNGLAECVKHGVIRDVRLVDFIETRADEILACESEAMGELVARNVAIKAAVVAADEREAGQRAHLNFGHTIGHAIEILTDFSVSHGQAVALGMIAANHLAVGRGMLNEADAERVETLLRRLALPVRRAGLDGERIWEIVQHDKKALGGQVRMVLATGLGAVEIRDDIAVEEVRLAVEALA